MKHLIVRAQLAVRAARDQREQRDAGAITEETAIRVILVGAAIAAGTVIAGLIAANTGAIPSP